MKYINRKMTRMLFILLCFGILIYPVLHVRITCAKSVRMNQKTVSLYPGKTYKLKIKNTKKTVKWKSSAPHIVRVSKSGKIKGVKTGTAVVIAKVGSKTLKCKVTVLSRRAYYVSKLRAKIIKTGKYDSSSGEYYIDVVNWNGDGVSRYRIAVKKKTNDIHFSYQFEVDDSERVYRQIMKINPVKNSTGTFESFVTDSADGRDWNQGSGIISLTFDGEKKGLKLKTCTCSSESSESRNITDPEEMKCFQNSYAGYLKEAFRYFNSLMEVKKTGVTMNKIGFKNI